MKICVFFPGGAGGNWLSYAIYCFENNIDDQKKNIVNYHNFLKSTRIHLTHEVDEYESYSNRFCFSDRFAFNFYLNGVKKYLLEDVKINNKSYTDRLNTLIDYASGGIERVFQVEPDLVWSEMFTDQDKFVNDLMHLSNIKIENKNIAFDLISEFKKTCVDPKEYFLDYSNEYWIGWCAGLLKYYDIPLSFVLTELDPLQLIAELKKFEVFFIEKTINFTFDISNT